MRRILPLSPIGLACLMHKLNKLVPSGSKLVQPLIGVILFAVTEFLATRSQVPLLLVIAAI
jgi:hypothetical protein